MGVKLHGVAALPVYGSEEAVTPAAKRKISHGSGNTDVYSDIAGRHFVAELAGRGSAGGKDRGHIAVGISGQDLDTLFQRLSMDETQDWPENLGVRKRARKRNPIE